MTTTVDSTSADPGTRTAPPFTRTIRIAAGVSLALAGILNGLSQYVGHLVAGDMSFGEYIRWGADNPGFVAVEQAAMVVSILFAPLGLLAMAQVTRWRAPVLTAIATPLFVWGMWGFATILAVSYLMSVMAVKTLGADAAVALNDGLAETPAAGVLFVLPHLVGSFLGLILLSIAGWKSRAFSRIPLVLIVVFLVWDFLLPAVGPLEAHVLLAIGWVWLGIDLIRMPQEVWRGAPRPARR